MKIDLHHTPGRARARWHKRLVGAAVAALLIFPAGLAEEAPPAPLTVAEEAVFVETEESVVAEAAAEPADADAAPAGEETPRRRR